MGRKKRVHPLPEWFDLKKYDAFLGVKNHVIFDEIIARAIIYSNADNPMSYLGDAIRVLESGDLFIGHAIRAGVNRSMIPDGYESDPFVSPLRAPEIVNALYRIPAPETVLAHGIAICPLNGFAIRDLYIALTHIEAILPPCDEFPDQVRLHSGKMSASVTKTLNSNLIYAALMLEKSTNEEIIQEIEELLPTLRIQTGIDEPVKREGDKVGGSLIKRIIEYKAIAMLDLELWSKYAKLEGGYTHAQLSEILYPDDEVTERNMASSRRKFPLQFCKHDQQDRVSMWLGLVGRDGKYNRDRLVREEFPPVGG